MITGAEMRELWAAELAELHARRAAKPLTPEQIKVIRAALLTTGRTSQGREREPQ